MDLNRCLNHYGWHRGALTVKPLKTLALLLGPPYFHILATFLILDQAHVLPDLLGDFLALFNFLLCVPEPLVNLLFLQFQPVRQLSYLFSPWVASVEALVKIPKFFFLGLVLALSPTLRILAHHERVSSRLQSFLLLTACLAFKRSDSWYDFTICLVAELLIAFAHLCWQWERYLRTISTHPISHLAQALTAQLCAIFVKLNCQKVGITSAAPTALAALHLT